MILRYRKVDLVAPTPRWVTAGQFSRHLLELQSRRFVYLDDYTSPDREVVVTFEDAWENVHRHALPVLVERGIPFEVFVRGGALGRWNESEEGEPLTRHMNARHLKDVVRAGGRLQWRIPDETASLDAEGWSRELTVDEDLARAYPAPHFRWLSSDGISDGPVLALAQSRFAGALAGLAGIPGDRFRLPCVTPDGNTFLMPASRIDPDEAMGARVRQLERALREARDTIAALRNSTSWKVTAPLRRLAATLRPRR